MGAQFIGSLTSDSSERLALINTSLGQARDTSTHVTFNALNLTPYLGSSAISYSGHRKREGKKRIFKCSVRI